MLAIAEKFHKWPEEVFARYSLREMTMMVAVQNKQAEIENERSTLDGYTKEELYAAVRDKKLSQLTDQQDKALREYAIQLKLQGDSDDG